MSMYSPSTAWLVVALALLALCQAAAKATDTSESLIMGVMTQQCFDTFFVQFDLFHKGCIAATVSKLLSYAILVGSFALKVPQILNIVLATEEHTKGLSSLSLYMDVAAFIPAPVYNILNGNAFVTYGEAVVVLIENCILVVLFWMYCPDYERPSPLKMAAIAVCGVAITVGMSMLPEDLWWTMPSIAVAFTIVSRVPQIFENFKQGHTGRLAVLTWVLNWGGAVARVLTTLQDPDISDASRPLLVGSFAIGASLSTTVLFQIAYFWKTTQKLLKEGRTNRAFVFVKPHAATAPTKALVEKLLMKNDIEIVQKGELKGEEIDKGKLIDQHYYSIASKATLLHPKELNVPADKFEEKFGVGWKAALAEDSVCNAMEACKRAKITADELDTKWATAKKAGDLIKFGGGFYCGKIPYGSSKHMYVFNGFFMSMRAKFTGDAKIYYYVVEWDMNTLSWADFRGKVLGPTDPAEGDTSCIRKQVADKWKELGLKAPCDVGDNGVHASASPFEALAEFNNWLSRDLAEDGFGKQLIEQGIPEATIKEWCSDPQVPFEEGGKTQFSLFDLLEDTNRNDCAAKCHAIMDFGKAKDKSV